MYALCWCVPLVSLKVMDNLIYQLKPKSCFIHRNCALLNDWYMLTVISCSATANNCMHVHACLYIEARIFKTLLMILCLDS